ncbi:hypothetical protein C9I56_13200 [Paraburkholderia caribensis]|nr:hypothetical protein C9I56_13200 [Paraburkholderia caribensis]QLB62591.1 hypothetical protein A9O66_09475 [Paraburkholderia caribensis]
MGRRRWTPEQKAAQASAIKRWKPWEKSTGPRTEEGKAIVAENALKHFMRCAGEIEDRKRFNAVMRRSSAYLRYLKAMNAKR